MKKDPTIFIEHILESIQVIEEYTRDMDEEDFLGDKLKQDAVMHRIIVIGEASRNLPEETQKLYSEVEWRKIIGMRNMLLHEYFGVNLGLIWAVVKNKLPELKSILRKAIL